MATPCWDPWSPAAPASPCQARGIPFEVGVSAILSARPDRDRLLEAFVTRLGTPVPGLPDGLTHTFPEPAQVTPASLAPIGLGEAETSAIAVLAAGREIPQVSDCVAFRLGQRQAFPSADPSLRAALADLGLRAPAASWRPWLALAAVHLMAHGDTLLRARSWSDAAISLAAGSPGPAPRDERGPTRGPAGSIG